MQDKTDSKNEEIDWMRRPKILVESVENWRKSNSHFGGSLTARRRSSTSWIAMDGGEDVLNVSSESPPDEAAVAGPMKVDEKLPAMGKSTEFERPSTRAGVRNLFLKQQRARLAGGGSVGTELKIGCSHTHDVGDTSTHLQLGCGSSSSLNSTKVGVEKVGEDKFKDISGKEISIALGGRADASMVPSSQGRDQDRPNSGAEAEGSQKRRTRLGKQVEVDLSDDEGSRLETLLCLGTHPRFVPGDSGTSRLGSSSCLPGTNGSAEACSRSGFEAAASKGKRKRDVDRSESAAAVGIALENVESESDDEILGGSLFSDRPSRRVLAGGSSLRERRRIAEREPITPISFLDSSPRGRSSRRNSGFSLPHSILSMRPSTQPYVLDLEQAAGPDGDGVEENDPIPNWLSGRQESSPSTANAVDESPARSPAQIIDLISPEPEHSLSNQVIDLSSPERPSFPNMGSRDEFAPGSRRAARRDRMRWTRGLADRSRPSTGRHQRSSNGAGSSQVIPTGINLSANEHPETESSRRRTEPSQPYFLRSGPRVHWDLDDLRILDDASVNNQPIAGNHRRRGGRFFPGADTTSSGGHPTIGGSIFGPEWLPGQMSQETFCYSDSYLAFGDSDDDDNTVRSRQLAEDERIARELQAAYVSEAAGGEVPDDESLARRLQAEEDNIARDFRHTRGGDLFGFSAVQRYLGDMRESPPRVFRLSRPRSETSSLSSSSSRFNFPPVVRNGRLFQFHRGQADMDAELPGGRVQFPSHMTVESLAQVDRDFNENDYEMLLALDTDIDRNRGATIEKINLLPLTTLQCIDKWLQRQAIAVQDDQDVWEKLGNVACDNHSLF
ncbi:hypothetical protein AXG93_2997s1050 [Marchantia polymorpha subsp. ruderalis]|uniref:Uncharacterized protein n=1 Tax=Marchantia polymorpha subsp. ruderalis TaxID=1480154 RepID=A0A176VRK2_MARPO|nr:hypothetical protein AXG93_2997s1050 [Marchantia polymorpha subsp. ruderalis]